MKQLFKRIFCLLCCLCAASSQGYALKLTIGTLTYNPPFEIAIKNNKKQQFWGFEIALMDEICRRIQAQCTFKQVAFAKIPEQIDSGAIDLGMGAIIITKDRKTQFLFSLPYKESHLQYIVLSNSKIKDLESLSGHSIGIYQNSPSRQLVLSQFHNSVSIVPNASSLDMLEALKHKKVNAIITNHAQALYWLANNKGLRLLGNQFPVGEGYGIMASFKNQELIKRINKALLSIENDGTYLSYYKQYF
jgi:ABC-type amino acid transport substrate-binding protein